ncbi:MAG: A/G-specific adenine glycosylase [Balneolaceae bacterium]
MSLTQENPLPVRDLISWFDHHQRDLPWRRTDDPWAIWVSEVMLQQTRVDTVIPYYQRFLNQFPTLSSLANASRQELLQHWEGLGYYSRGRNLQDATLQVMQQFDGVIPKTHDELLELKGIGPYTAAAVSSIAFGEPRAVVDGNVIRVMTRFFGIEEDIRRSTTRNRIQKIVQSMIPSDRPGDFNQAVMELGATICTPHNPACNHCPLASECTAYRTTATDRIPWKSPAKRVPHHQIGVGILLNDQNETLIALRPEDVMLGGLWEFPGGKQKKGESIEQTVHRELSEELGIEIDSLKPFHTLDHAYSHFKITLHAWTCKLSPTSPEPIARTSQEIRWVPMNQLADYPFPKANRTLVTRLIHPLVTDKKKRDS